MPTSLQASHNGDSRKAMLDRGTFAENAPNAWVSQVTARPSLQAYRAHTYQMHFLLVT